MPRKLSRHCKLFKQLHVYLYSGKGFLSGEEADLFRCEKILTTAMAKCITRESYDVKKLFVKS